MEKNWFNLGIEETAQKLETDMKNGLNTNGLSAKYEKYGYNELKAKKKKSLLAKFLEQFKDFMIIILIIAAIVSGIVGIQEGEGITDTIIILIVVILNAIIGVAQENKAEKSLEALQKMSSHVAKVMRDGKLSVVPSKDLVPGDIVILETGDYIPADLRIIEAVNLKSQESAMTGESVPVDKSVDIINGDASLGDRKNILFSSSLITYGRGKGIVVETGMNTEVGKIAKMIDETEESRNPITNQIKQLRQNIRNCCIIALCYYFCSRNRIWKRTSSHVHDGCITCSSSHSRRVSSCIYDCFSNWCSTYGQEKCNCQKVTSS